MSRHRIRAALVLATVIAALLAFYAELLILVVLAGCLLLAVVAEFTLARRHCNLFFGGLAGAFLAILVSGCLLPGAGLRAIPRGDISGGDVFVALGLGLGEDAAPGLSNQAIAAWIVANNPRLLPTITQEGVYRALKELEKSDPRLAVDSWIIRLAHDPLVYVDTREAARQALGIVKEGYHRPILVSHDLQLQRMAWHFEALAFAETIIPDLPAFPFDPHSSQHWGTRSRCNWVLLERIYSRPMMGRGRWVLLAICLGAVAGAVAVSLKKGRQIRSS